MVGPTVNDIFRDFVLVQEKITPKQLGRLAERGHSTVDRWLNQNVEPRERDVDNIIANARTPEERELAGVLTLRRMAVNPHGVCLDPDGNGVTNEEDQRLSFAKLTEIAGRNQLASCGERPTTADTAAAVLTRMNEMTQWARSGAAITVHLVQAFSPRRQARKAGV